MVFFLQDDEQQGLALSATAGDRGFVTAQFLDAQQSSTFDCNSVSTAQDENLDGILGGVGKLKEIGQDINKELGLHEQLLEDLNDGVEMTDRRIQRNTGSVFISSRFFFASFSASFYHRSSRSHSGQALRLLPFNYYVCAGCGSWGCDCHAGNLDV